MAVNNFEVKYVREEQAHHLINTVKANYDLKAD